MLGPSMEESSMDEQIKSSKLMRGGLNVLSSMHKVSFLASTSLLSQDHSRSKLFYLTMHKSHRR
jgi:hypothetical protein